jgi:hypothetical protein
MKKLTTLLAVPLFALGFGGCSPKEPVEKDYNTGIALISISGQPNAFVKDFDKDGLADAIVTGPGFATYYIKGYEKDINLIKTSTEMTPELRKYASDFIKAENSLKYEVAKMEYEQHNNIPHSADVKPEEINPFLSPFSSVSDSTWNSMTREKRDSLVRDYFQNKQGDKK